MPAIHCLDGQGRETAEGLGIGLDIGGRPEERAVIDRVGPEECPALAVPQADLAGGVAWEVQDLTGPAAKLDIIAILHQSRGGRGGQAVRLRPVARVWHSVDQQIPKRREADLLKERDEMRADIGGVEGPRIGRPQPLSPSASIG